MGARQCVGVQSNGMSRSKFVFVSANTRVLRAYGFIVLLLLDCLVKIPKYMCLIHRLTGVSEKLHSSSLLLLPIDPSFRGGKGYHRYTKNQEDAYSLGCGSKKHK